MFDYEKETLKDLNETEEYIDKYIGPFNYNAKYWFDYILDYVTNTKIKYKHFNRFLVYRKKSDEIWKQNFNDYFVNYQIEDDELIRV